MSTNSTHRVEVFRVQHLEKHPNADTLSIMRVFDAYQAVVRTSEYNVGDLACYVPPDNVLPDKPEYAWLKGHLRIKATKLRGIVSQGLVLGVPRGAKEGDDLAEVLGVTHYVPAPGSKSYGAGGGGNQGNSIADPPEPGPKYDIDSYFRYGSLIPENTLVEITEKIHGMNTRATYQKGEFWIGSHNHYRKRDPNTLFWRVFENNPWLKRLCKRHPGWVVYGEIFGNIQDLKYGMSKSEALRVFDIWTGTRFLSCPERRAAMVDAMIISRWELLKRAWIRCFVMNVPHTQENWEDYYVPILYTGPYRRDVIEQLMNGVSMIPGADHVREGIVIKPFTEIWDQHIGRLVLKAVSPDYLERS
jgi:RNA ligase (TIGR02306 family)